MAKLAGSGAQDTVRKKRPGVHSKNGTSKSKNAKLYKKKYRGQGR
jgi:hypothetical protein